jgi:hypothetical protein
LVVEEGSVADFVGFLVVVMVVVEEEEDETVGGKGGNDGVVFLELTRKHRGGEKKKARRLVSTRGVFYLFCALDSLLLDCDPSPSFCPNKFYSGLSLLIQKKSQRGSSGGSG